MADGLPFLRMGSNDSLTEISGRRQFESAEKIEMQILLEAAMSEKEMRSKLSDKYILDGNRLEIIKSPNSGKVVAPVLVIGNGCAVFLNYPDCQAGINADINARVGDLESLRNFCRVNVLPFRELYNPGVERTCYIKSLEDQAQQLNRLAVRMRN